jgi:hypothetical protein
MFLDYRMIRSQNRFALCGSCPKVLFYHYVRIVSPARLDMRQDDGPLQMENAPH